MPPRAPTKNALPEKRFWSRGFRYSLTFAFLLAPVLSLVVQFSRIPDERPVQTGSVKPRALSPFIAGLLANPKASEFECSLDEINLHLTQLLPSVRPPSVGKRFRQLEVRLEADGCTVATTYLWRDRDWRVRMHYKISVEAGRPHLRLDSGSLGRVHLGARTASVLQDPLLKLLPLLKKETVLFNRLENIRLEPNRVLLKVRASPGLQPI
jgi:hypothetical protein